MSHTSTASSNSNFFPGYFNTNGTNSNDSGTTTSAGVPPPPPLPVDTAQPPPPPPPTQQALPKIDLSVPPPPIGKIDTSVPPPTMSFSNDVYQNWAMQWQLYQQYTAAYNSQYSQSVGNSANVNATTTSTTPTTTTTAASNTTSASQWNSNNSSPMFRPRQVQQTNRNRFSSNSQSYNNVPPPPSLGTQQNQRAPTSTSSIRFQINSRPGRRSRFSSPPKQTATSETNAMDTSETESKPVIDSIQAFKMAYDRQSWPENLKKYWQSVESRCTTGVLRSKADDWLKTILVNIFQNDLVNTIDWMNKPLPEFLSRSETTKNFDATTSSLLELAKSSYAENKNREEQTRFNKVRQVPSESVQRAFADDEDNERNRSRSASSSSSSTLSTNGGQKNVKSLPSPMLTNSARKRAKKNRRAKKPNKKMVLDVEKPENVERLEKRKTRFVNEPTTSQIKPIQAPSSSSSISETNKFLVGTCQKIEKNYLRLTSEADPATIRPLSVLERAFPFVMDKYRLNNDWSYISDQLKSIRQDLMVQSIRNDFTVLVYEENARLSLEKGDREQFNQCQTQLEILYDSGCNREHLNEFLVYRLLYSLLLNDHKKTTRILLDIETVKKNVSNKGKTKPADVKQLDSAVNLCAAIRRKNYSQFFLIYRSLPRLAACLVNLFIEIYRKQLLKILVWGFAPTLPIDALSDLLAYESIDLCQKQLTALGLIFTDSSSIDCKASRTILENK